MIRKVLPLILFVLIDFFGYSQDKNQYDNLKKKSVSQICDYINKSANSEKDKAILAYKIVTQNVKYDYLRYLLGISPFYSPQKILSKCKTTCMGYSILYDSILKQLNIKSEIVFGFVKDLDYQKKNFFNESNHAWNCIYINQKWMIVDATWGAGYISKRKIFSWIPINNVNIVPWLSKFYPNPTMDQFDIKSEQLLYERLPEVPFWQLTQSPMPMATFIKDDKAIELFLKNKKTGKYNFTDTINSYLSDTINYEIRYAFSAVKFHKKNNLPLLICRHKINSKLLEETYNKILELEKRIEKSEIAINENEFDQHKEVIDSIIDNHKDISSSKNAVSSYRKKTKKIIEKYYNSSEEQIIYTYIFKTDLIYLENLYSSRNSINLTDLKTLTKEISSNAKNFKKHFYKYKKNKEAKSSTIQNMEEYHVNTLTEVYYHFLKLGDNLKDEKTLKELYKIQEKYKSEIKTYIPKNSSFYKKFYAKK